MSDWLNYHHLYYFWTVARLGTISKAATELRLGQPTISAQLKLLEESLGHPLFEREGRTLVLTERGKTVLRYADDIFRLGNELKSAVAGVALDQPLQFRVGIADVVPKLIAERLIDPALAVSESIRLVCHERPLPQLLAALALHELDVVIADEPVADRVRVKAFNHALGRCGFSFFASAKLGLSRRRFPECLHTARVLMPAEGSAMRRALEHWFRASEIQPIVVAEFDDSALLQTFGQRGLGVFAMPSAIEHEVRQQFDVEFLGRTDDVHASFFAISVERRLRHPAVVALAESARVELFT